MTILIIILALVFLVLTGMVLSKTQTLLKGIKGEEKVRTNEVDNANNFNGYALFVFWIISAVGAVWSYLAVEDQMLPEAASEHGKVTDYWFWLSMGVIMIAFFIVNSVLFYFPMKYRYKEGKKASFYHHDNKLEVIWTIIPAVVMAALVFTGLQTWTKIMADAPADAEVIEIMGKQFAWQVRYPGVDNNKLGNFNYKLIDDAAGNQFGIDFTDENSFDDFTNATEMHIPKGKPVLLKIRARDVLHSVFIPHMRVKMDAVPGMPTKFWFKPEKTTAEMRADLANPDFNYEIACTEVCGRSHFGMKLILVVEEQAEFDKWKKEQKTFLAENPKYLDKVPENLKAKAMKYLPSAQPDTTTAKAAGAVMKVAALK
jgi:cytochrome c oxidase subunit II